MISVEQIQKIARVFVVVDHLLISNLNVSERSLSASIHRLVRFFLFSFFFLFVKYSEKSSASACLVQLNIQRTVARSQ